MDLLDPIRQADRITVTSKIVRQKRLEDGKEVELSRESVAALQGITASMDRPPKRRWTAYYFDSKLASTNKLDWPELTAQDLYHRGFPSIERRLHGSGSFDTFSVLPETAPGPLPKHVLIYYFMRRLVPWLSNMEDQIDARIPKHSWMPEAMHHQALFHATLLCAAVHLTRINPSAGDQLALLWYKGETIRLANEKLNIPEERATDQMLLTVLILLYFNVGGGDPDEYEAHLRGINQMIVLRGGLQNLGSTRRMVLKWLGVCFGPWNPDWEYGTFSSQWANRPKLASLHQAKH
ncbi:hypothetical protein BP6252_08626 [Coleophoma cylindrospora]|uniref:Transcription factor domain-containing protein n=1 Tax=Coleophoma cylindrospora TaxID=1849047 RepID=A0A3D8R6J2_9HELO|nr:hypothetical protein BP6252_08626 [Coleophoma cylindrospora]